MVSSRHPREAVFRQHEDQSAKQTGEDQGRRRGEDHGTSAMRGYRRV